MDYEDFNPDFTAQPAPPAYVPVAEEMPEIPEQPTEPIEVDMPEEHDFRPSRKERLTVCCVLCGHPWHDAETQKFPEEQLLEEGRDHKTGQRLYSGTKKTYGKGTRNRTTCRECGYTEKVSYWDSERWAVQTRYYESKLRQSPNESGE
jgi:hypothetical protein